MNLSLPYQKMADQISEVIIPSIDLILPPISPMIAQPDNWLYLVVGQVERSVTQPAAGALGQSNFLQHYADQSHHQKVMEKWRDDRHQASALLHIWKKRKEKQEQSTPKTPALP